MNSQKTLPVDWKAVTSAAVLFTKSLLLGLDHATRRMEFDDGITDSMIENLPFEEAVEYLRKRNILSAGDYYKLSDKMKFRAFIASRIADGDLLKKLNMKLTHALESGESLSDFKRWTRDDLLNAVGMGSTNFSYWETVYRTNVQTAYNAGRAMGFEEDKPIALEFIGIDDARTTEICRQLQNPKIILPYDDPFWDSHWPPLHFNCRSTVRGIYDESELPESYIQPEITEKPSKGFGRFPLDTDDWWQELKGQAARAREYNVQREIESAFEKLILAPDINKIPADQILFKGMENFPPDGNYFDFAAHGTSEYVEYDGMRLSARELAKIIRRNKNFSRQNGVRLLSCSTGKGENSFAQNLANALGCEVKAPSDDLWVYPSGDYYIGENRKGTWTVFKPGENRK